MTTTRKPDRLVDYAARQAQREAVLRDLPEELRGAVESLPIGEDLAGYVPSDVGAEEAVVAALLLDDDALMEVLAERLEPADFTDERLAACYRAALQLGERQEEISIPTVAHELHSLGWLDREGLDEVYLVELTGKYFTAIGVGAAARVIKETAAARKVMMLAGQVGTIARLAPRQLGPTLAYLKDAVDRIQSDGPMTSALTSEQVIQQVHDGVLEDGRPVITTGLPLLDKALGGGLGIGELVVIAAKTSVGKTALAARIVREQTLKHNIPVGIILLEGRHTKFLHRLAAVDAGVSLSYVERNGGWDPDEQEHYEDAFTRLCALPLYFAEPVPRTALAIEQWMRTMARREGIKHFVIDHIDRLRFDAKQRPDMAYREALQRWGNTANEEGFVVTCLSQVNREVQWHPELRQLREAGAKEELAQIVLLLSQGDNSTYSNANRANHVHVFPSQRWVQRRGVSLNVEVAKFTEGEVGMVLNAGHVPPFYVDAVSGAVMVRGE
ncbi:MAG: AAA family ATPase [Dehalococcoidia bacterium]|nr:AAA family ATPase [Dehalococcoidia bacterium]